MSKQQEDWSVGYVFSKAFLFIMIGVIAGFMFYPLSFMPSFGKRQECKNKIIKISGAYIVCSAEGLVDGEKWCDELIEKGGVDVDDFVCPGSLCEKGQSSYVLNAEAVGKKLDELPGDMVLLFETVHDEWNATGGKELLTIVHHYRQGNVVFVDGSCKTFSFDQLGSLKWNVADSDRITQEEAESKRDALEHFRGRLRDRRVEQLSRKKPIAFAYCGIFIAAGLVLAFRYEALECIKCCLVIGLLTVVVGYLFGTAGFMFYRMTRDDSLAWAMYLCIYAAIFWGVIPAICYVGIVNRKLGSTDADLFVRKYICRAGMYTGVVCAATLHGLLGVMFGFSVTGLLVGSAFGASAGLVLGLITGSVLKRSVGRMAGNGIVNGLEK